MPCSVVFSLRNDASSEDDLNNHELEVLEYFCDSTGSASMKPFHKSMAQNRALESPKIIYISKGSLSDI